MRKMNLKLMLAAVAVALTFAWTPTPSNAQRATKTTRPVVLFGTSIEVGESTLTRTDKGVTMHLTVDDVPAGAYSAWIPIFHSGDPPPPRTAGWVGGHVVGEGGQLTFSVHLKEGEVLEGHPMFSNGGSLEDARLEDIGMVVRYHGPAVPGWIYEQTHTFQPDDAVDFLATRHDAP